MGGSKVFEAGENIVSIGLVEQLLERQDEDWRTK